MYERNQVEDKETGSVIDSQTERVVTDAVKKAGKIYLGQNVGKKILRKRSCCQLDYKYSA
jgi:hypothetical protein